jgi:hypothetical protein
MDKHDAWPPTKNFEAWMREHTDGIRNGVYSRMMKGLAFDPKYAVGFASYLLHLNQTNANLPTAVAFREHMQSVNSVNPANMSHANVAEHLLENDDNDYFLRGFFGVLDAFLHAFSGKTTFKHILQGCTRPEQVHEAVRWLYVWAGKELSAGRSRHSLQELIAKTETHISIPLPTFQEMAQRWWQYDDWTVVLARGKRSPTGMSIVLPLRSEIYDAFRNGAMSLKDIGPADLQRPSRRLLVVAIAQRLPEIGGDAGNTSKNLMASLVGQVSILAGTTDTKADDPLRLLTVAGTPQNRRRLEAMRYVSTGNSTRGDGLPLFERIYSWPMPGDDMVMIGISDKIAQHADHFLRPPGADEDSAEC